MDSKKTANFELGPNCTIQEPAQIGFVYRENCGVARIGANSTIRSGSVIYGDVTTEDWFQTGHTVLIREHTRIGKHVLIGSHSVIDGNVEIADFVKIESQCYIPTGTKIGTRVFFGPRVTLTNDRYPLRKRETYRPEPPIIEDNVTLGAGAIVCPGVIIGSDSFVAAGAVVTKDVPPASLVVGVPGTIRELPSELREVNTALSWREHLT